MVELSKIAEDVEAMWQHVFRRTPCVQVIRNSPYAQDQDALFIENTYLVYIQRTNQRALRGFSQSKEWLHVDMVEFQDTGKTLDESEAEIFVIGMVQRKELASTLCEAHARCLALAFEENNNP
jgi:hypothetical protein